MFLIDYVLLGLFLSEFKVLGRWSFVLLLLLFTFITVFVLLLDCVCVLGSDNKRL